METKHDKMRRFLVPCGPGNLPMLVHNILNVLNNNMGRPSGTYLKDIMKGLG